jgi:hypothetical protein
VSVSLADALEALESDKADPLQQGAVAAASSSGDGHSRTEGNTTRDNQGLVAEGSAETEGESTQVEKGT